MVVQAPVKMKFIIPTVIFVLSQCCHLNDGIKDSVSWKNIISTDEISDVINRPYVVFFFAHSDFPQDDFARRFNKHFADAKKYLQDFGVELGMIDCFTSPDIDDCVTKKDASDKVHFFRNGRLLTDLPLDSMFNFDAIVANILHLVLLQEVPLIQTQGELEKVVARATGKRDVILARMRAVGIPEDRAFIETAFAFNQKYQFIMTTVNDNFGIDSTWEAGNINIWLLGCKNTESKEQCPVTPFKSVISLERLIIFIKVIQVDNAVELTEDSSVDFFHLNIPVVYLSGSHDEIPELRSAMHTLATEYRGNVGFILLDRDMVTDQMKNTWDLSAPLKCTSVCAVFKTQEAMVTVTKFSVENMRIVVEKIFKKQRSRDLEELEDDEEDDDSSQELYATSQERQDDPVAEAVFKLQKARQLNISETQQLTDKTFPEFISSDSVIVILFTVKWNPICTAFLETYQDIGMRVRNLYSKDFNPMARVECSNWPDVCELNNVTMYPTLKIFKESVHIEDYRGRLDEANLLKYYFLHSSTTPIHLNTAEQFSSFYEGSYPSLTREILSSVVFGIFSDPKIKDRYVFEEVGKHLEGSFLLATCIQKCANEGLKAFGVKGDSVIITVKWSDPYQPFVVFDGAFNKPSILSFISKSSQSVLSELNPASLPSVLGNSETIVIFFHQQDNQSKLAEIELAKVAARKQFDTTPITWIDASGEGHLGRKILKSYSLPVESDVPQIVFLNRKINSICWYPHVPLFSESLLTDWLDATLTGRGQSCSAALRHREWTEMVQGYDFLAYIRQDLEAKKEAGKVNIPSGRIRQKKKPEEMREDEVLSDESDSDNDDYEYESEDEEVNHYEHTEL